MKTFLSILVLLSAAIATSSARLGETEAECEARYGKSLNAFPVPPDQFGDSRRTFAKEGILIEILFWKGRAVEVRYKAGPDYKPAVAASVTEPPGTTHRYLEPTISHFPGVTITTLLTANAGGSVWTIDDTNPDRWKRRDGGARATNSQQGLYLVDLAFEDAAKANREKLTAEATEAEKTKLQGF